MVWISTGAETASWMSFDWELYGVMMPISSPRIPLSNNAFVTFSMKNKYQKSEKILCL